MAGGRPVAYGTVPGMADSCPHDAFSTAILAAVSTGPKDRVSLAACVYDTLGIGAFREHTEVAHALRSLSLLGLVVGAGGVWRLSDKGGRYLAGQLRL